MQDKPPMNYSGHSTSSITVWCTCKGKCNSLHCACVRDGFHCDGRCGCGEECKNRKTCEQNGNKKSMNENKE